MKKIILVITLVLSIFLITGCGAKSGNGGGIFNPNKNMTCTKESVDEDGYKTTETMDITYNSNRVLRVKSTNISETDPTYIDFAYSFGSAIAAKFNEIEGMTFEYVKEGDNKLKMVMDVDFEKINPDQMKELLGDSFDENSFYSRKNVNIEEFKKENLSEYTCK